MVEVRDMIARVRRAAAVEIDGTVHLGLSAAATETKGLAGA